MSKLKDALDNVAQNIELVTSDPVALHGFTQVPNFILDAPGISIGAKVVYAKFLQYAWHNDGCYPGQRRLGEEIGLKESSVSGYVKELKDAGLIEVQRRGLGKTNKYRVMFQVRNKKNVTNKNVDK